MKYCTHCGAELNDDAVFCVNCGKAVENSQNAAPQIKYCTNCGAELKEGADYCVNCGCRVEYPAAPVAQIPNKNKTIETIAKVFMVLTCVAGGVCAIMFGAISLILAAAPSVLSAEELAEIVANAGFAGADPNEVLSICIALYTVFAVASLISLAWCIPLTVIVFKRTKIGAPISTAMKVCILIFVNIIPGILLLCRKEPSKVEPVN